MNHNNQINDIKDQAKNIDGWLSNQEGEFLYKIASDTGRGVIVEIGSWQGKSTIWLASGSKAGKFAKVFAVDPHTGAPEHHEIFRTKNIWTFDKFKENIKIAGVADIIEPIVDRSENVAKNWQLPVEFLWIDGAHAYDAAKQDLESWLPHLIDGAIVAFHDSTYEDVKSVVRKFLFGSPHFKNGGVIDTISYARYSRQANNFFDRLGNRYAMFLNDLQGFLRNWPLPQFLRKPFKYLGKKFLLWIQ